MRRIPLVLGSLGVIAMLGCSSSAGDDGSSGGDDTGSIGGDTGSIGGDSTSTGDSTTPTTDSGAPIDDSSTTPPTDSGTTPTDSGTTPKDTGTTPETGPSGPSPMIGPCEIYPADNPWNQDVSKLPLHPSASTFAGTMHTGTSLHADWGTTAEGYGIPYNVGTGAPPQKMTWTASWGTTDSDPLKCADGYAWCYPIPGTSKIEGPSDSHLLFLDTAGAPKNCTLYELWQASAFTGSGWTASNGAIFHLGTNVLRSDGLTSADAAGLPILPGLVRYEEVKAGAIKHAIRFTMNNTYNGYIHPATHYAGLSSSAQPLMGLRLRLKSSVVITGYSKEAQVILQAMKTYGIILADNGSNWYITGDENDGWGAIQSGINDAFGKTHGGDFEAVDTGKTITSP